MDQIVVGRTVRLRSGGPLMTVKSIDSQTLELKAACVWFDEQNQPQEASYPLGALVLSGP